MITNQDVHYAITRSVSAFKAKVPIRTGNMRNNATKLLPVGLGLYWLYIDKNVAPYFPYVNGPWVSPQWGGKENPNEGFFMKAAIAFAEELARRLNGKMEIIND